MNSLEAFEPACIAYTDAKTKDEVLHQIADLVAPHVDAYSAGDVYHAFAEREKAGSTGFELGVAIPHCLLDNADRFVAGVLISRNGVPFDSFDGEPARVIVFTVGPSSERSGHIELISAISRMMLEEGVTDTIIAADDPQAVFNILRSGLSAAEIDVEHAEVKQKNLFTILIQREEIFDDLLKIFSVAVPGSIMVFDAQNAASYLNRMPLFSSYWTESKSRFNRIIVAVVARDLSNDTIRRIHSLSPPDEHGVLIAVQELAYSSGVIDY